MVVAEMMSIMVMVRRMMAMAMLSGRSSSSEAPERSLAVMVPFGSGFGV